MTAAAATEFRIRRDAGGPAVRWPGARVTLPRRDSHGVTSPSRCHRASQLGPLFVDAVTVGFSSRRRPNIMINMNLKSSRRAIMAHDVGAV